MPLTPDVPLDRVPPVTHRRRARRPRRIVNAEHVAMALGDITPECEIFALTGGTNSIIDVLRHCLSFTGPARCDIATWTASDGDLRQAHAFFLDGKITELRLIVDPSFQSRKPKFCKTLIELFGNEAIRTVPIHGKFATLRTSVFNLAIRSSMNLNPNRRVENVEISDDPALCQFLTEFVERVWERPAQDNFRSQEKRTLLSERDSTPLGRQPTLSIGSNSKFTF